MYIYGFKSHYSQKIFVSLQTNKKITNMNDDRYIRYIKDLEKDGNKATITVNIHPTSKWVLRTILDNLYAEEE